MRHHYDDIRSRIAEEPRWFDEKAVPRYCEFHPDRTANIYAREAVLFRIRCQGCPQTFDVCMSWSMGVREALARPPVTSSPLPGLIRTGALHYGDPPNVRCCPAGPTMNSEPMRVLQFWRQGGPNAAFEWVRVPDLEVALDPDWIDE